MCFLQKNFSFFNVSCFKAVISSAEQYFKNSVLKENPDISNGIGMPDLYLVACLAGCWILLFLTLWKGVASSGKVKSNIIHTQFVVLKSSSPGCLFYSHFSIPCPDYITGERTHA